MSAQLNQKQLEILHILRQNRSMPFLELTSLVELDDKSLERILRELEEKDLVRISNPGNPLEEIVTVREKAFAM